MDSRFDLSDSYGYAGSDAVALQRGFINRVFGWMTGGLAITGAVACLVAVRFGNFVATNPKMFFVLLIAELLLVFSLSAAIRRISPTAALLGFVLFAALNGVTLSWIFMVYSLNSITATFLTTSLTFGVMGLYGWITNRDLTGIGSLAFMALWGLIIASLVNLFLRNQLFDMIVSMIGVLVFVGLTAYDTQKIKQLAFASGEGVFSEADGKKAAIIGALTLYLDFINLFLYMLRFFGNRK